MAHEHDNSRFFIVPIEIERDRVVTGVVSDWHGVVHSHKIVSKLLTVSGPKLLTISGPRLAVSGSLRFLSAPCLYGLLFPENFRTVEFSFSTLLISFNFQLLL